MRGRFPRPWLLGAVLGFNVHAQEGRAQDTIRVSVDSAGVQGDLDSAFPSLSEDGSVVVFFSEATNLVPSDTNGTLDVFAVERSTGIVTRVSVASNGAEADSYSESPSQRAVSSDGIRIVFSSHADNLCSSDTNATEDVFVRDRVNGTTERVSVDSAGGEADGQSWAMGISADGTAVVFESDATNLVAGDANQCGDVFVHHLLTGETERISVDSLGNEADGRSEASAISSDGRFVAFSSDATNLVAGDANGKRDVFLRDRLLGTTERVSVNLSGKGGNGISEWPSISGDGRYIAFHSSATNLVTGDTNGLHDVFVRDLVNGTTIRCSVDSFGAEGNGNSWRSSISTRGNVVIFVSEASNLVAGDTNHLSDCFVHDIPSGTTIRVNVDSAGGEANDMAGDVPAISGDERTYAFDTFASNLVAGDTNGVLDVFIHELCSVDATWSNYGTGLAGTFGVPSITSNLDPVLGSTVTVAVSNSYGAPTFGLLALGFQQGALHTPFGADLLVVPTLLLPISFSYGVSSFTGALPDDVSWCGFEIDLQAVELDPGAPFGVSFTPGLELDLGR